jgi:uncharacterized protein YndB with AHSA1/START domain
MTSRREVVLQRDLPFPVDRVWRAVTVPELLAEWLLPNDFRPEVGHDFAFTNPAVGAISCKVLQIEPGRMIRYAWRAFALDSTVTLTLEPQEGGTRLTIRQEGFVPERAQEFHGARAAWTCFLDRLATLLATI